MEDNYLNDESGFFGRMIESNRKRIDYEIDDDLFDKCVFDRDGNLIGFDWRKEL